jgi:hypothetical protein
MIIAAVVPLLMNASARAEDYSRIQAAVYEQQVAEALATWQRDADIKVCAERPSEAERTACTREAMARFVRSIEEASARFCEQIKGTKPEFNGCRSLSADRRP